MPIEKEDLLQSANMAAKSKTGGDIHASSIAMGNIEEACIYMDEKNAGDPPEKVAASEPGVVVPDAIFRG